MNRPETTAEALDNLRRALDEFAKTVVDELCADLDRVRRWLGVARK